ncbi:hypothetical protein Q757_05215 [Oenococcus alcoholitolerans]|uniref:Major facilitator superfamily (MFS) profile domain-containing protein n=1 Tax=Oenococcus alcoholitolerans TaxID=931074 RepID=A0ABR4XQM6_9LACO|nr:hypothetical protein Q757_05215 [Oenococcus alcoholitolerans]
MKNKLGIKSTLSAGFVDLGMVPIIIGMALGMYVFGSILDKIGPKKAFSIFLIMSSLLVYTFNFASNLLSMTLLGALIGFSQMACMAVTVP